MMLGLVAVEGFFPSSGAGPWGNYYIVCWKFWFPRVPPGIFFLGGTGERMGSRCSALLWLIFLGGYLENIVLVVSWVRERRRRLWLPSL